MSKQQDELKQRLLTHMNKDYPNSKRALEDITDEESEMLDSMAEFINSEVRASLDRLKGESENWLTEDPISQDTIEVFAVSVEAIESERQSYE
jgi:hypothetical protein